MEKAPTGPILDDPDLESVADLDADAQADVSEVLRFETLDGEPAAQGMQVRRRSPEARLIAGEPISAYQWRLSQDRAVMERGRVSVPSGDQATAITIRPTHKLRRRGNLPRGYFFPPISNDLGPYWGWTYPEHSPKSVDINRGEPGVNQGDPVLAAAPGTVVRVDPDNGEVEIAHWRDRYRTLYAHMQGDRATLGSQVGLLTQIGEIGDKGDANGTHLHHCHFRMRGGRHPITMTVGGDVVPKVDFEQRNLFKTGWTRDPQASLWVKVRPASTGEWSRWQKLDFFVAREVSSGVGPAAAPAIDAGSFADPDVEPEDDSSEVVFDDEG